MAYNGSKLVVGVMIITGIILTPLSSLAAKGSRTKNALDQIRSSRQMEKKHVDYLLKLKRTKKESDKPLLDQKLANIIRIISNPDTPMGMRAAVFAVGCLAYGSPLKIPKGT